MPKEKKGQDSLPKGSFIFQGKTVIMGDNVNQKIVNGNEIHGDNVTITGDGNIVGNKSSSRFNKTISNDEKLATAFNRITYMVTQNRKSSNEEILSTLQSLQKELKRGDKVDTGKISPWLTMIKTKAPEIVGSLLEILVHPLVGKTVEAVAKLVLNN